MIPSLTSFTLTVSCCVLLVCSGKDVPAPNLPSVVVIGSGVAGLTAAATLQKTGKFNVTLLEAMARIGGRTHTLRFPNGYHVEMGAEWVHGQKGNAVFELMNPLGVLRSYAQPPLQEEQFALLQAGRVVNETMTETLWELFEYLEQDPEGWSKDARSGSYGEYAAKILDKFKEKKGFSPLHSDPKFWSAVLDWMHRGSAVVDSSDNWFELSARDDGDQFKYPDGLHNVTWKPPIGYSTLHEYILTGNVTEAGSFDLPPWIKLSQEVINVDYTNESNVQVCVKSGDCFKADHVIFTPSLGVLKANSNTLFKPMLPAKKQLTIQNLGFGTATKYYLEFSKPWWPSDYNGIFPLWDDIGYDYTSPHWMYWRSNITTEELKNNLNGYPLWVRSLADTLTIDSRSHPNMLRIWITGPTSKHLSEMDPGYVQMHIMRVVRRFVGFSLPAVNIPDPIATHISNWWADPFTRGVYSFRTLEADRNDVWVRDLAEPILASNGRPMVCFAGEATHPIHFSTVNGAYETGIREAERVMAWHSGSKRNSASTLVIPFCISVYFVKSIIM